MFCVNAIRQYRAGIWLERTQWALFKLDTRAVYVRTRVLEVLKTLLEQYVVSTVGYLTTDMYARTGDMFGVGQKARKLISWR